MAWIRKHEYKFDERSTPDLLENMVNPRSGIVVPYGRRYLVADQTVKGVAVAAIYEKQDPVGERGTGTFVDLVEIATETFEDTGHAIEWAIRRVGEMDAGNEA